MFHEELTPSWNLSGKKELIGLLIVRSEEMRNESRRKEKSDEEGKRMVGKKKTRYSHENSFILETEK